MVKYKPKFNNNENNNKTEVVTILNSSNSNYNDLLIKQFMEDINLMHDPVKTDLAPDNDLIDLDLLDKSTINNQKNTINKQVKESSEKSLDSSISQDASILENGDAEMIIINDKDLNELRQRERIIERASSSKGGEVEITFFNEQDLIDLQKKSIDESTLLSIIEKEKINNLHKIKHQLDRNRAEMDSEFRDKYLNRKDRIMERSKTNLVKKLERREPKRWFRRPEPEEKLPPELREKLEKIGTLPVPDVPEEPWFTLDNLVKSTVFFFGKVEKKISKFKKKLLEIVIPPSENLTFVHQRNTTIFYVSIWAVFNIIFARFLYKSYKNHRKVRRKNPTAFIEVALPRILIYILFIFITKYILTEILNQLV
jgi:hypothetical protein